MFDVHPYLTIQAPSHFDFPRKARATMLEHGFQPDFPPAVLAEIQTFTAQPTTACRDLRDLAWSSIDNTESRDLDQIEWAEQLPDGNIRILVGIADVDSIVKKDSATDVHARANCTSVYTGGPVFPMLPEKLSTDLTSLGQGADRLAIIMEFVTGPDGDITCSDVCTALVRNKAKLNYTHVASWLDGKTPTPSDQPVSAEILAQLKLQFEASKRLMEFRKNHGALTLGSVEFVPMIIGSEVKSYSLVDRNSARDIIESFMIAANVAMARHLREEKALSIRRVVRIPKRWDRIQAIVAQLGTKLPDQPDSKPLNDFLAAQRAANPDHFPELSLSILKSMGPGEYIVEDPGAEHEGHFGLAVNDYTHSTAPNRRYADLITQRLLKASINKIPAAYTEAELTQIAARCTDRDSAARQVERFMKKVAAALMLANQIGHTYDAIITGVTPKGTFARLLSVPAEGRIIHGETTCDVGQKIRVRIAGVNPDKGFIDLEKI